MQTRLKKWVLLSGCRYSVAAGILALLLGVVLVPLLTQFTIRNTTPLTYLASALVTGNVTLITIVVAITQVVLAQELDPPGSLRDEIERTVEYRQTALNQRASPTEPSDFLQRLLRQTRQHARSLADHLPEPTDDVSDRLLTDLPKHCQQVDDWLESTSNKLSNVIIPLLDADYGDYINSCHQLQTRYDEDSHEELHITLDHLTSDLENLAVARQYFTTAFVKEELATLSRSLLYIGILAVSTPIALLFQFTTSTGSSVPRPELFILAVLTTFFGLMPLAVLIAFVLRIATVIGYIATITPFNA